MTGVTPVSSRTWQIASNLSWLSMMILSVSMHLHPDTQPASERCTASAIARHTWDARGAEALYGGPVHQARGAIHVALPVSARMDPVLERAELHLRQGSYSGVR